VANRHPIIVFWVAYAFLGVIRSDSCLADALAQGERFRESVLTILENRCYDCHGDGANKGSLALDQFESDADLIGQVELWWKVAKNIRARLMPPSRKPQLTPGEREQINQWIQSDVFGIDHQTRTRAVSPFDDSIVSNTAIRYAI